MKAVLFTLCILLSVQCSASEQSNMIKEFNSVAAKNISGEDYQAYISMKCGNVTEDIAFISGQEKKGPILEVDSEATGHVTYISANYGEKLSDDFETELGWEYNFYAPRGQIVVTLENNGTAFTTVSVLHGGGYKSTKSKCKVENFIKS